MKRITFLCLFVLTLLGNYSNAQCDYTLRMDDSFGDGWNGNTMDLLVNGTVVLDDVTVAASDNDGDFNEIQFTVNDGDLITTIWNGGGSFLSETSYEVLNNIGISVGSAAVEDISTPITVACASCLPASATASVVNDCANDQFSLDVDVTDLGDSTTVSIANDAGVASTDVTTTGVVTVGPFPIGTPVNLTLEHESDVNCNVSLGDFSDTCPPPNDDCDGAIALTVGSDLSCANSTSGTTVSATASTQVDDVTGTPDNDVWFSFVASAESHVIFLNDVVAVTGFSTDMGMGLYNGSTGCESLVFVDDSDPNELTASGLVIGDTYLLRVYGWSSTSSAVTNFNVCVGTPPAAPANDDCDGALPYTVGTDSTVLTSFSTFSATETPIESDLDCDSFGTNYGVWYTFTAPSSIIEFTSETGFPDLTLFQGADCDNLTEVPSACLTSSGSISGLTAGEDYYALVWTNSQEAVVEFSISYDTCPAPSSLTTTTVTDTSASLSWTAGNLETEWEVLWGPEGFDPATEGTVVADNDGSLGVELTGLTAETEYDYYVTAVCSTTDSSEQVGPFSFTTACAAISAPYDEDFETFTVATSDISSENCWSTTSTAYFWRVADSQVTASTGTGPAAGVSDGNYVFTEATSGATGDAIDLTSPLVDLSNLTAPALSFDYHMFGEDMGDLEIIVNDGTSNTTILTLSGQQQTSEDDAFVTQFLGLDAYSGQTIQVIFRGIKGAGFTSDIAIDNVSFGEAPSCLPPADLAVANISGSNADFSWTDTSGGTAAHLWAVFAQGDDPNSAAPLFNGQTNPGETTASEAGLDPTTDYDFYVAAICGPGNVSTLAGPVSFTTTAACEAPTGVTVGQITDTTAEISWTLSNSEDSGYEWVVMADGEDPLDAANTPVASGITADGDSTVSVTGLTAITNYDVYVRSICSPEPDPSSYAGPVGFTTACSVFTPDYEEDFATMTFSIAPDCWEEAGSGDPTTGPQEFGSGLWGSDGFLNVGFDGSARINLYTDNREDWLISPSFDLSAGGYELVFDIGITAFSGTADSDMGSDDQVQLLYSEDGGSTWVNLQTWEAGSEPSNAGETLAYDLSIITGTSVQFAFWGSDGPVNDPEDYNIYVDNFKVRTPLSCSEVTGIAVSNITNASADVSWNDNADATAGYNWFIYEAGADITIDTAIDSGTTAAGVSSVSIGGLDPLSGYDVYVEGNCDANGLSPLAGPVSLFTGGPGSCSSSGSYSYDNNESSADALGFIADNPGDFIELTFTAGSTETCCDDWVITDAADGTGNIIATGAGSIVGTYESSTGEISFYVDSDGSVTGTTFEYSVNCFAPPTCLDPTGVTVSNITTTTADFSWDEEAGATNGYIWFVYEAGADVTTATAIDTGVTAAGVLTASSSLLNPLSGYDVYVQSDCDTNGLSTLSDVVSFTTSGPGNCSSSGTYDYDNNQGPADAIGFVADTPGDDIELVFTAGETESCCDDWVITDAADGSGNIIATGAGSIVGSYVSTTGEISFYVDSDGSVTGTTFEYSVNCGDLNNQDFFNNANFSYYPNPVENNFTIESRTQIDQVVVYNMLGKEVRSIQPNSSNVEMNLNNLQAGVYLVKATIEGQTQTFRVIKK